MDSWLNVVSVIICYHVHFHVLYFSFSACIFFSLYTVVMLCEMFFCCCTHDSYGKSFCQLFVPFVDRTRRKSSIHELICVEKWLEFSEWAFTHPHEIICLCISKLLAFRKWFMSMKCILCISYFALSFVILSSNHTNLICLNAIQVKDSFFENTLDVEYSFPIFLIIIWQQHWNVQNSNFTLCK